MIWELVKFTMCILVSRDCVPFCKYTKCHVYPGDQDIHDKLNQIHDLSIKVKKLKSYLVALIVSYRKSFAPKRIHTNRDFQEDYSKSLSISSEI